MRGWSRNTQPMALRKVGNKIPMLSTLMATVLYGISVRSMNQAKMNPSGTETAIVIAAKISVVVMTR